MEIKAVIFDLDGTLYDNSRLARYLILHSLGRLRLLYAERLSRLRMSGRYYGRKGATYEELFKRIAETAGTSEEKASRWYWEKFMPLQVKMLRKHFHRKPWVEKTLAELRSKGIRTACFSEYSFIREKLEALDIDPDSFDLLIDAPTAGGCKPCRKAFIYVAAKLDTYPSEILMVGDREDTDGAGAEACNMQFLLVPKQDTETLDLWKDPA